MVTMFGYEVDLVLVFAALFGMSEALAQIPQIKANSVFQAIYNFFAFLAKKKGG